jgi:hypothetical protein
MEYEKSNMMAAQKQNYAQGLSGATNAMPELQSTNILNRLRKLQQSLKELNASTDAAAEKIVGSMPTPISNGIEAGEIKGDRSPMCFLDALTMAVNDLEHIVEGNLRDNINRFHRFF